MNTYATYLMDLQRHFSRWSLPADYAEQCLADISGGTVRSDARTVSACYTASALSKAAYVRDNGQQANIGKAQVVIDTLIARRDSLPDPQAAAPSVLVSTKWVRQEPAAPIVTTPPVDRGPAGLSGWGDGEIGDYYVTVGGNLVGPSQPLPDLYIHDIIADKVTSLLMQGSAATLDRLHIARVKIGARNKAISVRGASKDVLIEDAHIYKVGGPAKPSDYPEGIMLGAKVADRNDTVTAILRRVIVEDFATAAIKDGDYVQGDNIMIEASDVPEPTRPFLFEDVLSRGATDGGWDCKARALFRRCEAVGNHTNVKLWASSHFESFRSITPRPNPKGSGSPTCGFWFPSSTDIEVTFDELEFVGEHLKHFVNGNGGKTTVRIKRLLGVATADLILVGSGLTVIVANEDLSHALL